MSSHLPIPPDPMPLREALRGLRFLLRRGGETLAETLAVETLPGPAAGLAGAVIREVEGLARNLDVAASGLAHAVLGGRGALTGTLQDLTDAPDAPPRLAAAVYVALGTVLIRLGAPGAFVSEAAARAVFAAHLAGNAPTGPAIAAAHLTLDLLEARVIRATASGKAARVAPGHLEPVAIFAVLLWLQTTRSDDENKETLDAATDLAVALADDIAKACAGNDTALLATLFARYAAHV